VLTNRSRRIRLPSISNCSGIPILNVPKDAASLALIYSTKVGAYQLNARVADVYVGPSFDQAYAFGIPLPSYSLPTRASDSRREVDATLFVDNLTNKVVWNTTNNSSSSSTSAAGAVSTNQPRTFGPRSISASEQVLSMVGRRGFPGSDYRWPQA